IRNRERITGIVSLHSYTRGAYTGEDLALLQLLADHCSGALERLRAQEALRESEQRFYAFMEHTPVVAYIKSKSGQYLYAIGAWARGLNLEPTSLLGRTDFD